MVRTDMGNGSLTREAIYELRRLLIGRLQVATRGIPRSRRIEELQAFARDWREVQSSDRMDQLALLMHQESAGVGLPEIFLSLAHMTEPVRSGSEPEALPDLNRPSAHPVFLPGSGGPNSWWVGNRQGDLFPSGLATQPV